MREHHPTPGTQGAQGNLGQKKARREKASDAKLEHMGDGQPGGGGRKNPEKADVRQSDRAGKRSH